MFEVIYTYICTYIIGVASHGDRRSYSPPPPPSLVGEPVGGKLSILSKLYMFCKVRFV